MCSMQFSGADSAEVIRDWSRPLFQLLLDSTGSRRVICCLYSPALLYVQFGKLFLKTPSDRFIGSTNDYCGP